MIKAEKERYSSFDNAGSAENIERGFSRALTETNTIKLSAVFENPLQYMPRERLMSDVRKFCKDFGLLDHLDTFRKGALAAQHPSSVQDMKDLSSEDKRFLAREHTHKWSQPWQLYW
jgi:hypothetical protein